MDDVSFTVDEGEIFGILGPNGAGKTTTVECVEGLRTSGPRASPRAGARPAPDRAELHQLLGAQLQESQLPDSSGRRGAGPVQLLLPAPGRLGALMRHRSG